MQDGGAGTRGRTAPQHVWVSPDGRWAERSPGLLLEWQRRGHDWEALAVWAGGGDHAWELRQGWLPAARVRRRE